MRAGTIIQTPDGREWTAVYNGLDGVGVKEGRHDVTLEDIQAYNPNGDSETDSDYEWFPDAMLREPYRTADLPCIGSEYEIVKEAK